MGYLGRQPGEMARAQGKTLDEIEVNIRTVVDDLGIKKVVDAVGLKRTIAWQPGNGPELHTA